MEQRGLAAALRRGLWVFVALVVLTVVEFILLWLNIPRVLFRFLLLVINGVDAGLILYYFMHFAQLWREET